MTPTPTRRPVTTIAWPLLAACALLLFAATAHAEETAAEIVDAAVSQNSTGFQSGQGRMTVTTEDKTGDRKVRTMEFLGKGAAEGRRTLVRLLQPDEVKGQAFLFREVKDGEDQVYWYLPAFGVTRRISGGKKKGAFMGTHFTFADLESRDIKDADYKKKADEKIGKIDVYVIEATPRDKANTDYSKVVLYIRKSDKMLLKARFFDKGSKAEAKTLFVEKLDTSGDRKFVKRMTLRPKAGGYTRMEIDAVDFATTIDDVKLTPEALSNE